MHVKKIFFKKSDLDRTFLFLCDKIWARDIIYTVFYNNSCLKIFQLNYFILYSSKIKINKIILNELFGGFRL